MVVVVGTLRIVMYRREETLYGNIIKTIFPLLDIPYVVNHFLLLLIGALIAYTIGEGRVVVLYIG